MPKLRNNSEIDYDSLEGPVSVESVTAMVANEESAKLITGLSKTSILHTKLKELKIGQGQIVPFKGDFEVCKAKLIYAMREIRKNNKDFRFTLYLIDGNKFLVRRVHPMAINQTGSS